MSARSDQSKSTFSMLALCMLLAGGAFIASTDVGAQPVYPPSRYRAKQVDRPSQSRAKAASKFYSTSERNPCGYHWHMGKDGKCYMN
jgi:hypothetical protein